MSLVKAIFLTLKLFEISLMFLCGKQMQSSKSKYWHWGLVAVFSFACVEGLRFGRLIDWNVYYFRYVNIGENFLSESYEPVFKILCYAFYNMGFPYWLFIFCQCFFFFFCVVHFVKRYRNSAMFILPVAVIVSSNIEQFIRWYLSISFVLLSFSYCLDGKKIKTLLFMALGVFSHYGTVLFIPFLLLYKKMNGIKIPELFLVGAYCCFSFVLSLADLAFIGDFTNYLYMAGLNDDKYGMYLLKTQTLMMGDGRLGYFSQSLFFNIKRFLTFMPFILLGRNVMKNYNYGLFVYYLAALGIIITPVFTVVELFDRYANFFNFFSCIVAGVVYSKILLSKKSFRSWKFFFCIISFALMLYTPFANIMSRTVDESMLFIWDAAGRHTLPLILRW
ncbi:MAG: EpsG family protein [Fibrobacteraceae bacterium]|nr:EpsG family protein [Fibrobacteraceae bacterium]